MKKIYVIGLGWLGKQLVCNFKKLGYDLIGLNRTIYSSIEIPQFEFNLNSLSFKLSESLKAVDYFIITIPPSSSENYARQMHKLLEELKSINSSSTVIYTSSTSVYGNQIGNVYEESELIPETSNANEIVEVEKSLNHFFGEQKIILRLAGLIGDKRHPARYLSGKKNIKNRLAPINLIHANDIINAIHFLIEQDKVGIYNLAFPNHPTKQKYYTDCCQKLGIPLPNFDMKDDTNGKIVHSLSLKEIGFIFQFNLD